MTTSGGSGGEMERLQTIEEAAESYSGGEGGPAMRGFIAGAEWAAAQTRWQVVDGDRVEQISCANCAAIRASERAARHELEAGFQAILDEYERTRWNMPMYGRDFTVVGIAAAALAAATREDAGT